ncbi:MAG: anthranilate phosphoribosyltransferase [Steroidobacteraceae bacterium]
MQLPRRTLEQLLERRHMSETQAGSLLRQLTEPTMPAALAGALLAALRAKGETPEEVRGFARAMRELARRPQLPERPDAIDIVGTGGDGSGSLNLSTGAALLTAACGLPVIKHGNRAITSRSGSADLIEQLGLALPMDEVRAGECFAATGFTFLYAPYFHPAMQAVAPIRAALGVRTLFNLLGPLTNPAAPRYYLIGAFDVAAAALIADTLCGMEVERAWVVHGAAGWDEATPIGPFQVFQVQRGAVHRLEIDPCALGLEPCMVADLAGGDAAANLAALRCVFSGEERGAHRAALLLQSGIALVVGGRAADIATGMQAAAATLDSGRAQRWLDALRSFAAASGPP